MKKNIKLFEKELGWINDLDLRSAIKDYMTYWVGDWFWKESASKSGRYHPAFSQGEGGLVRHTKAVAYFVHEMLNTGEFTFPDPLWSDYAVAAAIIHDSQKYGDGGYKYHPENAADEFAKFAEDFHYEAPELMLHAVKAHMGKWTVIPMDVPMTPIDHLVHLADYVASRKALDMPEIVKEWEECPDSPEPYNEGDISDLPFIPPEK